MGVSELGERLYAVSERADKSIQNLERERNYILETMQRVQNNFGDQQAGQQLVLTLLCVINSLAAADSTMNALRSRIGSYISETRK